MPSYRIKFPNAKKYLYLEDYEDVVELARVLQLGYGVKANRDECELICGNADDRELILAGLCDIDIDEIKADSGPTIHISLPGTDRWFEADREDVFYARMLIEDAYGCTFTPENTQIKVDDSELSNLIKEAIRRTSPTKFSSVIDAICSVIGQTRVFNTPFNKAKRSVEVLYEK